MCKVVRHAHSKGVISFRMVSDAQEKITNMFEPDTDRLKIVIKHPISEPQKKVHTRTRYRSGAQFMAGVEAVDKNIATSGFRRLGKAFLRQPNIK